MSRQAPSTATAELFAHKGAAGRAGGSAPTLQPSLLDPVPTNRAKSTDQRDDNAKTGNKSREPSEPTGPASLRAIEFRRAGALAAALAQSPATAEIEARPDGQVHNGVAAARGTRLEGATGTHGPLLAFLAIACFAGGLWYALSYTKTTPRDAVPTAPREEPAVPVQRQGAGDDSQLVPVAPGNIAGEPADEPPGSRQTGAAAPTETSGNAGLQPSFDLIRIEPNGEAVIAGRAAPNSQLILLDNGQPIGKVTTDWAGEWAFIPTTPLAAGDHEFSLVIVTPQGTVAVPGVGKPDKGSFLQSPNLDSRSVIKAKAVGGLLPEQPASGVLSRKDQAAGRTSSFVIQLSSTTSLKGAEQEWLKLKRSFPQLLEHEELNVHEVALDNRGTWYRVRTGNFSDKASARKLCAQLRAKRQDCLVIER